MGTPRFTLLRRTLPRSWREWLFEPSVAELIGSRDPTTATDSLRFRLRALTLWLQCWFVGLRSLFRRPIELLRGRRTDPSYLAPPTRPRPQMESLFQDLRYALRSLRSAPGFVAVAVLTLALGTGANVAIFGVVDLMMLRPLAGVDDGEELAFVMAGMPDTQLLVGLSYPNYADLKDDGIEGFDGLLAYSMQPLSVSTPDGGAQRAFAHTVSANYFDLLGVKMHAGRGFLTAEGDPESSIPVVVVDYRFWQQRMGGDPDSVGATLEVNGIPFTVVGIAPEEYLGVESMLGTEIYLPPAGQAAISEPQRAVFEARRANIFRVLGRLADGTTLEQAQAAADAAARRIRADYPEVAGDLDLTLVPEMSGRPDPSAGGQFAGIAAIFLVLVMLVLTIACANVANLMLARATGRSREIAVRSALGAGRLRVMRQLGVESLLLGLGGGVVGLMIAVWAVSTLRSVVAGWQIELPVRLPLQVDVRAVLFGLGIAVIAGLIAGLLPAFRATSGDLTGGLNEGARGASASRSRQRARSVLVVAQVAVSLVLLIAAGLFLRSLQNAQNSALGFDPEDRLLVSYDPVLVSMAPDETLELHRQLVERTRALPGVRAAGVVDAPPFSPRGGMTELRTEEQVALEQPQGVFSAAFRIMPGYLEAAGTRLLQGRDVAPTDDADSPNVALVNEAMARRFFPEENPIGQSFFDGADQEWEVIGVVEQGKYLLIWEEPMPAVYLPLQQSFRGTSAIVVHSEGDPLGHVAPIREALAELAPDVPVHSIMTMATHLRDGRALMLVRLASGLVAAFGVLGLLLATVGLYGVIAYSVNARLREFGVRVALGAEPGEVLRMVVRHGLVLAGIGTLVGALLAAGMGRMLSQLLIDVSALDPVTFGGGILLVVSVAVVASLVPAWRATRVDPMVALRDE